MKRKNNVIKKRGRYRNDTTRVEGFIHNIEKDKNAYKNNNKYVIYIDDFLVDVLYCDCSQCQKYNNNPIMQVVRNGNTYHINCRGENRDE